MVASDAVLVADRRAVLDDQPAGGRLERQPAPVGALRPRGAAEDVGHVDARSPRCRRGTGGRRRGPARSRPRARRRAPGTRAAASAGRPRPVGGRLQGVDRVAGVPQRVAQVRLAEPAGVPAAPERPPAPPPRRASGRASSPRRSWPRRPACVPARPSRRRHGSGPAPRRRTQAMASPSRRCWPARASVVRVSAGVDSRIIDSGSRASARSWTAAIPRSQSGTNSARVCS